MRVIQRHASVCIVGAGPGGIAAAAVKYRNAYVDHHQLRSRITLNTTVDATKVFGPVYWKDNTYQVVTQKDTEALMALNGIAGIMANTSATNGSFVFILVSGHIAAVPIAASTAAGDSIIGATGTQLTARVAKGTAPTNTVLAMAETAVSGGKSDLRVCVEDQGF